MSFLPFALLRPWLLAHGALTDRDRPNLDRLGSIDDSEHFVWAILPHAARSFAPSILLLPAEKARAAAVGYLYARMLDTYEDLSMRPQEARKAISLFAERFMGERPKAAPPAPMPDAPDQRDRTHLLLIEKHRLVDEVYLQLDTPIRDKVRRLIEDMARGMSEFSAIFERQGGVLRDEQQVLDYCHRVIGLPALYVTGLFLGELNSAEANDALEVSELIQLANITRDVEKDLQRGIAYHPALAPHLGSDGTGPASKAVTEARRDLVLLATQRAGAFRRLVDAVELPRHSPARAAAVLMMLYTDRHYRSCAIAAGLPTSAPNRRSLTMVLESLPAALSPKWAERILIRVEQELLTTT